MMGLLVKTGLFFSLPFCVMAIQDINKYIDDTWLALERSCLKQTSSTIDPKLLAESKSLIYISQDEDPEATGLESFRVLPNKVEEITSHGLLFLPKPYITPGGRFNEMYGWDSYFIVLGLKASGKLEMAKNMVDNLLYQVRHYGHVLNSNRTYHLTRSQPPILSRMVLEIYENDLEKLKEAYPLLVQYRRFWTKEPRLVKKYRLSRYYDDSPGPAIEVLSSEIDHSGYNHFDRVEALVLNRTFSVPDSHYDFQARTWKERYYLDDRAMRESGFDVTCCFGPYGIGTTDHLPVCLNTLLYIMEKDLAAIADMLGLDHEWGIAAEERQKQINHYLWNEDKGLYFPYNTKKKAHHEYPFLTTFYPLFAKIATKQQAAAVVNQLHLFERGGGLMAGAYATGCQWDAPYGWAPFHWIAVEGLRNYGYYKEADRIARKFKSLIEREYQKTGAIFEKYDVEKGTSEVHLRYGYESNEQGFGWTNAVYLLLSR